MRSSRRCQEPASSAAARLPRRRSAHRRLREPWQRDLIRCELAAPAVPGCARGRGHAPLRTRAAFAEPVNIFIRPVMSLRRQSKEFGTVSWPCSYHDSPMHMRQYETCSHSMHSSKSFSRILRISLEEGALGPDLGDALPAHVPGGHLQLHAGEDVAVGCDHQGVLAGGADVVLGCHRARLRPSLAPSRGASRDPRRAAGRSGAPSRRRRAW